MHDPGSTTNIDALSAELEAALVRVLRGRYESDNRERFGGRLLLPVIALSDSTTHLGRWNSATRTIEISRRLILTRPWLEVTSVLEHEMACLLYTSDAADERSSVDL